MERRHLKERELGKLLTIIQASTPIAGARIEAYINQLHELLKEADSEDFFGTEGWRHRYE